MLNYRYKNNKKAVFKLNELQLETRNIINSKIESGIYSFESIKCSVCDSNDIKILSEKDRYGLYTPVVICKKCGLVQINPRMNESAYNSFYNLEYRSLYVGTEKATDIFFAEQYEQGRKIFNYIIKNTKHKSLENLYIIEVGCGAGGILKYFHDNKAIIKGCDLGEAYLNYGKEKYNLDLIHGTIDSLDPDQKADIIIYSHVFEHILDLNSELFKISNYLKDDGYLYIEVPGIKNILKLSRC